jgi:catechol 2,3-dioxygenase-like lactoylglutathione lyase family enzyme|tara:strand:+ start:391 stop:828 length:438 start_codon:yes stop_codon:yes gene_type:complete
MHKVKDFRHIGITVQNLQKSVNFFVKDLGFKIHKKMSEEGKYIENMLNLPNVKVVTVKLNAPDGNLVELLKFKNFPHKKKWQGKIFYTGPTHFALTVKNLNSTYKKLNKKYKFNAPPQYSPDGYAKVTFFKGPENLHIELVELLK